VKRFFIIFGILLLALVTTQVALADRHGFINTVVIDPGHGGRDPGAVGRNSKEKDLTLAISLKLGEYIKENMPDVKVIYTREKDEFVELFRRAQIANENNADLFISIHCNSSRSSAALGTETFVMGLHRSEANLEVARKENASILFEEDYMDTYDGFDPHSPEANIIFSLYQNAYLDQSLSVASLVQDQFRERARRIDRGVKQAGFLVLYQITMPGILVEAGFLSNPREEQYLMSESGQAYIASAIYRAFRDYKEQHEANASARLQYLAGGTTNVDHPNKPPSIIDSTHIPAASNQGDHFTENEATQEHADKENCHDAGDVVNSVNTNIYDESIDVGDTEPATVNYSDSTTSVTEIYFRVQIAVSSRKRPDDAPEFKGLSGVNHYVHQGLFKYTVGNEKTLESAVLLQKEMHRKGFSDAFVVAFLKEERISPQEAIRLLSVQSSNQ
jgi:N-acetylmuramoyl-L-alanine amidase